MSVGSREVILYSFVLLVVIFLGITVAFVLMGVGFFTNNGGLSTRSNTLTLSGAPEDLQTSFIPVNSPNYYLQG